MLPCWVASFISSLINWFHGVNKNSEKTVKNTTRQLKEISDKRSKNYFKQYMDVGKFYEFKSNLCRSAGT